MAGRTFPKSGFVLVIGSLLLAGCASKPPQGRCFWMENYSGKYQWVDAEPVWQKKLSKRECYALDSCSGGLKQSGGGCYKWAVSPDSPPIPW